LSCGELRAHFPAQRGFAYAGGPGNQQQLHVAFVFPVRSRGSCAPGKFVSPMPFEGPLSTSSSHLPVALFGTVMEGYGVDVVLGFVVLCPPILNLVRHFLPARSL
jgi:hypothetical protein